MPKLTLTDISSGYSSTTTINANNALVETALENTLSRDGTSPNTMSANLDMNSNKVTNVTDGTNNQDAVTLAQLNAASVVASTAAGTAVTIADANGNYTNNTAESVLEEIAEKRVILNKTADTSRSSQTTASSDPHLGNILLPATGWYRFQAYIRYYQNVGNLKLIFEEDLGTVANGYAQVITECATAGSNVQNWTDLETNLTITNTTDTENVTMVINGVIECTATGGTNTMNFSWAQETSSVNATTLFEGSHFIFEQLF